MKYLLLSAALILPAFANAEVIARYNGIPVTRAEIDKSLAQIAPVEGTETKLSRLPADFQKNLVDKYIENKLIIDAARKQGLNRNPEIVAKLREAEEFLLQEKYLSNIIKKNATEAKMKQLYKDKYKGKEGQQEVQASHILVKTEEEAKEIRAKLDKGEDFEKLAKEKSVDPGAKVSGGDLGFFTYEQMVPEFSKVAFDTKPGTYSNPVKTDFGWHVIKVIARKTKETPKYEEVKEGLANELAVNIIRDESERLKSVARVQYFGDIQKSVVEADLKKKAEAAKATPKIVSTKPASNAMKPIASKKPEAKAVATAKPAASAKTAEPAAGEKKAAVATKKE